MFNFLKKKSKKEQWKNVDVDRLKEALEFLRANPKVMWDPYPSYDRNIFVVLNSLGFDEMYMEKSEELTGKPIEEMSLSELKVMYSFIVRSEKYCDGSIAGYVEDGSLAKMAQREIDLLKR